MTRPWVRVVLVFAGLSAIAAAGYVAWSSTLRERSATLAFHDAEEAGRRGLADSADLRAAQQAYVAVGQGNDFWFARVSSLSKDLDDVLAVFKRHLTSPEALAAVDEAVGALRDLQQVDGRARELTRAHRLTQASDVIFGDGFDVTQKSVASIARALVAEATARDAAAGQARRQEAYAAGAAAGVTVVVLLLLIPGRAPKVAEPLVSLRAAPAPVSVSRQTLDDLNDFGVVARPVRAPAVEKLVDLGAVASLCTDLARVSDTRGVPALLERAATLLNAAGIVVWIADPDGRELSPIVVHGYSPQLTSRLGTIPRDAANVTASAYRTGLLQTVKGDAVSNGAVAAPLVGPGGCVGVMAIEMKNGGEQREPLLAAVGIIASQLSTLVGPPSARPRAEAAG